MLIAGYKISQCSPQQETSTIPLVGEMLQLKQQLTWKPPWHAAGNTRPGMATSELANPIQLTSTSTAAQETVLTDSKSKTMQQAFYVSGCVMGERPH